MYHAWGIWRKALTWWVLYMQQFCGTLIGSFLYTYINFIFLRDNYNMLLISQLEPFSPRLPSTLCMRRCQFSYKHFSNLRKVHCNLFYTKLWFVIIIHYFIKKKFIYSRIINIEYVPLWFKIFVCWLKLNRFLML